ncbi:kinesin-like protein KIN-10C [Diospyros lotus]|uniref:kinesin-like protein KIN-10C n=1 Tax=Diospyros lotus TaxID=55363 RepID=UPI00224FB86B|nr:kinesin-like protein KIN-10C [Diospyros lotus]
MASLMSDADRTKPRACSIPSHKVRIVARIRGFTNQEAESSNGGSPPWISITKPTGNGSSEKAKISFRDQSTRDAYEVDYCYEQNEDNGLIFSREIKPLISGVFDGQNLTVIAYGARGSGKTYSIQGTEDKQGLATLAVAKILSMSDDVENSVSISFYEVFQDHVYDLLDPTRPEVHVLEDAQGQIKLKGLSQGFVKSIDEFHKLYNSCSLHRAMHKPPFDLPRRSHKGLIVRILFNKEDSNVKLLGKINFVDLAGYEDARRKSCEGLNLVESNRVNKSLYALLNVVYALNTNEGRVPYRESKLTRMLQDSFGGTNHVVMLTCLNPWFCQDTLYAASLASRSCQATNRVSTNSAKKSNGLGSGSVKPIVLSSSLKGKPGVVSTAVKKPISSRAHLSEKNTSCVIKGRELFDEGNHLSNSKQGKFQPNKASVQCMSDISSSTLASSQEEDKSIPAAFSATVHKNEGSSTLDGFPATVPEHEEISLQNVLEGTKHKEGKDILLLGESYQSEVTANIESNIEASTYSKDGANMENEKKSLQIKEDGSPPLSARLRDISNHLKSLCSSIPIQLELLDGTVTSCSGQVVSTDIVEPKTPVTKHDFGVKDEQEFTKFSTPSAVFGAQSSKMKDSLVQEYLRFLNSASKEELKELKGIGEKRASYIIERREQSPEPFKDLDDLKDIGLSAKQIKGMMRKVAGELFS